MIIIGLVGRIGAGKSTVARRLAELGAEVIDADQFAHEVLGEPEVRKEVVARFGGDVEAEDGGIRREVLARRVFGPTAGHAAALEMLEAIIHPRVGQRIEAAIADARGRAAARGRPRAVVLDVPLLVQAGWAPVCDRLIEVECDHAVRRRRLADRNLTIAEQEARDAAWSRRFRAEEVPRDKTDVVDASGDLSYTREQVDRIWAALVGDPSTG